MVTERPRLGRSRIEALRRSVVTPEHGSTADAVTEALREAIVTGMIPPGTWLREADLARSLKVSRTPVRDALLRLADDGLTVRAAHQGSVVAPVTADELVEVYAVREMLEGMATRLAAGARDPVLIAELTELHDRMVASVPDDTADIARLDLEFHRVIRRGSGNRTLERALQQIEHAIRRFPIVSYDSPEAAHHSHDDHGAILRAIGDGDGDAAEQAAIRHMRRIRDLRLARLSAAPTETGHPPAR